MQEPLERLHGNLYLATAALLVETEKSHFGAIPQDKVPEIRRKAKAIQALPNMEETREAHHQLNSLLKSSGEAKETVKESRRLFKHSS
jgi:hypothetical protein